MNKILLTLILSLTIFDQFACWKRSETVLPIQPNEKPISFRYYEWSISGTAPKSPSNSMVIEGQLEEFAKKLTVREQNQIGGSVVSDTNWQSEITDELKGKILQIIAVTELETIDKTPLPAGGGGSGVELTLNYAGARTRNGKPSNQKDWNDLVQAIKQLAIKNKSD